jgi:hypothetical protein
MDGVGHFLWLAAQALQVALSFPPTAALTLGGGAGALAAVCEVPPDRRRRALAGAVIPLVVPAAILLCGVLLAYDTDLDEAAPRWPEWLVGGLVSAQLPLAAALVGLLRGARWFALTVSVAVFGYSCGAAFMSTMSVSGRWL